MTKLVETDEVEKGKGLMPRGGTKRLWDKFDRDARQNRKKLGAGAGLANVRLDRARRYFSGRLARSKVGKSLAAWDETLEKAKGMIRGGSKRMLRRVNRAADRAERKAFAPNTAWMDRHLARRDKLDGVSRSRRKK